MLHNVQSLLMQAILQDDPPVALARLIENTEGLNDQERSWLKQLDADGLRMSSLLIKKLRFESLTRADEDLKTLFEECPESFVEQFRAYDAQTPPSVYFPGQEADLYRRWLQKDATGESGQD